MTFGVHPAENGRVKNFAWAALAVIFCASSARAQDELADIDKPAPMFRLPAYNGKALGETVVGLDKYVGPDAQDKTVKAVLVSFMASFCKPCKKEMPYLEQLHERYKDLGLRVMSVSIDTEEAGQKEIDGLISQNKITYPVLKDRFNLVARRWLGTQSPLPSVFLVRPDGTVSKVHRGYNEEASVLLATEVESALGIKRGPSAKTAAGGRP
jgi:peroxiredoxin